MDNVNDVNVTDNMILELKDKVDQLRAFCNFNRIPLFIAMGVGHDANGIFDLKLEKNYEDGTDMTAYAILPEIMGLKSKDERFADFVNVVRGYKTSMKPVMEVNDDEFEF